ncbi:MAG TPA: hypothetical protein VKR56_04310 [Candidatus Cybelea sp.]|nr:hypothetical protein [Candidatus Cybelea sp.]
MKICALAAILAGCSGAPSVLGPTAVPGVHHGPQGSWVSPAAKQAKQLLYVSRLGTFEVDIFRYNSTTMVGKLTNLNYPYGLCSDRKGDVWITEFNGFEVVEYAHGGTTPLKTLATGGRPIGCSVDAKSGDLAVADFSTTSGSGDIEIFKNASGQPAKYTSSNFNYLYPPGYDNQGNIFVEGRANSGATGLTELRKGGTTLVPVSLKGGIFSPAGVMWDGKYVAAADQEYHAQPFTSIYRLKVSDYKATIVSFTVLTDPYHIVQIVQPWIQGDEVAGASSNGHVCIWEYPRGGDPRWTIKGITGDGVTVSTAR